MTSNFRYYADTQSPAFQETLNKHEFTTHADENKRNTLYQDPNQLLLRNFISQPTIYESVLLYNFLGSGKTCAAITIAEGFKEYISNLGRKIVVLVKNKNIQKNFMNELMSKCTGDDYLIDEERDLIFNSSTKQTFKQNLQKKEVLNKAQRLIASSYTFITYGSFVNRVLGAKDYIKDEIGRNTNKLKREGGQVIRKRAKNPIKSLDNTVVIVDEAHNITNNDVYIALHQVLSRSFNHRLILLTATPIYDNPKEIFELANLLNVNDESLQLPIRNELFKPIPAKNMGPLLTRVTSPYINSNILKGGIIRVTDEGMQELQNSFIGKVSFLRADTKNYPKQYTRGLELIYNRRGTTNVEYCLMSPFQYQTYLEALSKDVKDNGMFDITTLRDVESQENESENVPSVSRTSSLYKNSSDASTMTYPNNLFGKNGFLTVFDKVGINFKLKKEYQDVLTTELSNYSCKLAKLIHNLKKSKGNAFIYSSYVSYGGTSLLKLLLQYNGYKEYRGAKGTNQFVMYDESSTPETREKYRRVFNSPENKHGDYISVIIGSPIISEGITLKNVRQVHLLEPCWNMSRINQIIGRSTRNYSHHDLKPEERNVSIFKYVAVFKSEEVSALPHRDMRRFFIDREKYILSEEKDRSNKKVERILKEMSFNCELSYSRNRLPSENNGLPECDYTVCDYNCAFHRVRNTNDDKSTYIENIKFFDKFDLQLVSDTIKSLFKKYFVWKLDDIVKNVQQIEPMISNEAVYYVLGNAVQNKTMFEDMYGRDGFIINKGDFYIFNSSDIDIQSSLYSKILDFSVDKSKYTLQDYVKQTMKKDLFVDDDDLTEEEQETDVLSDGDKLFNETIIRKHNIFGTYRQRGTYEEPYGKKDNKFRIVDLRSVSSENDQANDNDQDEFDKRKVMSGMWIGSFKKAQLVEIANALKVQFKRPIDYYDKQQLGKEIEKFLVGKNLVLR